MEFYENEKLIEALEIEEPISITVDGKKVESSMTRKPIDLFNYPCFGPFKNTSAKLKFIYDENIFWQRTNSKGIQDSLNIIIGIFNGIIEDKGYLKKKIGDSGNNYHWFLEEIVDGIFKSYYEIKLPYIDISYLSQEQLLLNIKNYEKKLAELTKLTKLYENKLKLSKPAEYFEKKATEYTEKADHYMECFIWLMKITAAIPVITIIVMLMLITDSKGIDYKVFFIPIASLTAISFFTALTFRFLSLEATFLANEMDQKHVLIFTYLATSKETTVSKESLDNLLEKIFSIAKPRQKSVLPQEILDLIFTLKNKP